jgi:hypothetical protein
MRRHLRTSALPRFAAKTAIGGRLGECVQIRETFYIEHADLFSPGSLANEKPLFSLFIPRQWGQHQERPQLRHGQHIL